MGFNDLWNRTLVYFGIAEDEEWDDDLETSERQLEESYRRRDRQNVRRLPSSADLESGWESQESAVAAPPRRERSSRLRSVSAPAPAKVHLVAPPVARDSSRRDVT